MMNYNDFFMPNSNISPSTYAANVEAAAHDEYFDTMGGLGLVKTAEDAWKRFVVGMGVSNNPSNEMVSTFKTLLPPVSDEFIINTINYEYVSQASVLPILYIMKVLADNGIDASLLAIDSSTVVGFSMLAGININPDFSIGPDMMKNKQPLYLYLKDCRHKEFLDGLLGLFNDRKINGYISGDNSIIYVKLAPYKNFDCLRDFIKMVSKIL